MLPHVWPNCSWFCNCGPALLTTQTVDQQQVLEEKDQLTEQDNTFTCCWGSNRNGKQIKLRNYQRSMTSQNSQSHYRSGYQSQQHQAKGESPLQVFNVASDWDHLNWCVSDFTQAWSCALDIEGWLKVRHAGNGTIEHVSGENGQVGAGYVHTHAPSRTRRFESYYLIDIDH